MYKGTLSFLKCTLALVLAALISTVAASNVAVYKIAVVTGTPNWAGTDANVFITLIATSTRNDGSVVDVPSPEFELDNELNNFENGHTDFFTLVTPSIGNVYKIRVRQDGTGRNSAWFLERVKIASEWGQRGEEIRTFEVHQWLGGDQLSVEATTPVLRPPPNGGINRALTTVILSEKDDADHDGIRDDFEAKLLAKFRPYYRFSSNNGADESYLPDDPIAFVRRSKLYESIPLARGHVHELRLDRSQLGANPSLLLSAQCRDASSNPCGDLLTSHDRASLLLESDPHFYHGFDDRLGKTAKDFWPEIERKGNVGLFGHVVKDFSGNFVVEYFQFYPYNDASDLAGNPGDHEADLTMIRVVVDSKTQIISVSHFVHGSEIMFNILQGHLQPGRNNIAEYRGFEWVNWKERSRFDRSYFIDFCTNPYLLCVKDIGIQNCLKAQNNLLYLYSEQPNAPIEEYTHPVMYIEHGTHENWPSSAWSYRGAPDHGGDRHRYLTSPPPNLGEVEHPLGDAARIITGYAGFWGSYTGNGADNSPGPSLHRAWTWPQNSELRGLIPESAIEGGPHLCR